MWSGPRNISTAMMYSFGNRPDCFAWDEPFYAFSLMHHGNDHPLRDEILAAYETDYEKLAEKCQSPPPAGKQIFYQKHMTHHMLKGFDRSWIASLSNAFLIRAPEKVLASYVRKWADVSLRDIGFVEQSEIFHVVAERIGRPPPVIDAEDVLADPRATLAALCAAFGIPFRDEMLAWPKGPKSFDGIWARHWYGRRGARPASRAKARIRATAAPCPIVCAGSPMRPARSTKRCDRTSWRRSPTSHSDSRSSYAGPRARPALCRSVDGQGQRFSGPAPWPGKPVAAAAVEGRKAHSITAAAFLARFAGDVPWAHLDIAGVSDGLGRAYAAKGASGWGVRLLVELGPRPGRGLSSQALHRAPGGGGGQAWPPWSGSPSSCSRCSPPGAAAAMTSPPVEAGPGRCWRAPRHRRPPRRPPGRSPWCPTARGAPAARVREPRRARRRRPPRRARRAREARARRRRGADQAARPCRVGRRRGDGRATPPRDQRDHARRAERRRSRASATRSRRRSSGPARWATTPRSASASPRAATRRPASSCASAARRTTSATSTRWSARSSGRFGEPDAAIGEQEIGEREIVVARPSPPDALPPRQVLRAARGRPRAARARLALTFTERSQHRRPAAEKLPTVPVPERWRSR